MSNLSKPAYVSALLARYGIRLKKRWGQNFLVDENILQKIVATAELQPHDLVLEVDLVRSQKSWRRQPLM